MKFSELLETAGDLPLSRTGLLLAGDRDPADARFRCTVPSTPTRSSDIGGRRCRTIRRRGWPWPRRRPPLAGPQPGAPRERPGAERPGGAAPRRRVVAHGGPRPRRVPRLERRPAGRRALPGARPRRIPVRKGEPSTAYRGAGRTGVTIEADGSPGHTENRPLATAHRIVGCGPAAPNKRTLPHAIPSGASRGGEPAIGCPQRIPSSGRPSTPYVTLPHPQPNDRVLTPSELEAKLLLTRSFCERIDG